MCPVRKQTLKAAAVILTAVLAFGAAAQAGEPGGGAKAGGQPVGGQPVGGTAGGVTMGEGNGGITDRAYVTAPPNYLFVIERERGSFLDCGEGQEIRSTDNDGRDLAVLRCGVTLTETVVIPAAAASARIIIHY